MLGSEFEKIRSYSEAKTHALWAEAEVARSLPKSSWRHQVAQALRSWAEWLEPPQARGVRESLPLSR
ncbi:hypothetical protein [Meiothermus granaticius]|uniref:Uncharacterized protein n=1 Tax=Meiothermus granaticius NBRC 107808 TaxID=1227551 RepID=A0A399F8B4_9DEIN|nr:hypothetical protein [Meiothermus granaticius]RIH92333.1 hypothetical protein Mgrana_01764 [Meiothermus granaticius NBRC 107808]GEM87123.1 hypothetical protein MGR01S_17480 [Meiothermus granaticius NBRC 107808]